MQEKLVAYRSVESRLNSLLEQQKLFSSKIMEVQGTMETIEEMGKVEGQEMLFPLGSAAYVKGLLKEKDSLLVEVGSGVALEKSRTDALATLSCRKTDIQKAMDTLQNEIKNASTMMQNIEREAQEMMSEQQDEKFKVVSS